MPERGSQLELLEATDWDVLIVLDACRADAFQKVSGIRPPYVSTVRSPGVCTAQWIAQVGPLLEQRRVLYFTANPIVDREVAKRRLNLELVSIWERHWSRFTRLAIPSVHPLSVNAVVMTYQDMGLLARRTANRRVVVHYLQPHSPYIGSVPLAVARWGRSGLEFCRASHRLPRPEAAVKRGEMDWELLRRAYRANLALAWDAARYLASQFQSNVVVTSDHGELLGEDGGKFGHEAHWRHSELYEVPWMRLEENGHRSPQMSTDQDQNPQKISENQCESVSEDAGMRAKLEALGYA